MKNWQKILIMFLVTAALGGAYLLYVFKQRENPGVVNQPEQETLSKDDLAVVRAYFPQHFDDLERMQGTRMWMKNGYTLPYYPYSGGDSVNGKVDFTRKQGLLPPDQPLDVKKVIKVSVPANVDDGVTHGTKQAMITFTLPGKDGTFAAGVGAMQGTDEEYIPDLLFYYDDPHTIYDHWGKEMWAAVDAHQVKPGMSELEVRTSIGSKMHTDGQKEGDRTVTYDENGRHWTITFEKNHATDIKNEPIAAS